ncbi:hypothetical protein LL033_22125 [Clostridium estertheticum]|uniref:hypothetical protein n=1 Tax=Clostridium estertheticum TaxID=238834 RepID=UPI001C0D854A|nr:hypothetical protein [Clostridium estertheticum]MBU3218118.1 hypothetical protein [Clostridium estertheticum]WAG55269.1 hypothetical protein LL033_22125 [Clostridium estertheticum]
MERVVSETYKVGANISFKNKDFYVNHYIARSLSGEVIYKYRLCRKNGVWQTKGINSLIGGASSKTTCRKKERV